MFLLLFSVNVSYSSATQISARLLVGALVDLHTNGTNQGTKSYGERRLRNCVCVLRLLNMDVSVSWACVSWVCVYAYICVHLVYVVSWGGII